MNLGGPCSKVSRVEADVPATKVTLPQAEPITEETTKKPDNLPFTGSFALPLDTARLTGTLTADCEFFDGEQKIAHKQKLLTDIPAEKPEAPAFVRTTEQQDTDVTVTSNDFTAVLQNGVLARISKDGKVLLDAPMKLNCWRAPTDNDGIIGFSPRLAGDWADKLVHSMRFGCHRVTVMDSPTGVTVTSYGKFLPESHLWGFDTVIVTRISAHGITDIAIDLQPYGTLGPEVLPRVGVYFTLPSMKVSLLLSHT